MGSPLSPILANLCMEFVETEILQNCEPSLRPIFWVRYVDDIFIVFKGNPSYFDNFLQYVNGILPSIQFTVEHETDSKLPFLDMLIYHDPVTFAFKFTVYRKETNAETYIHFFSWHNTEVKTNILVNFVLRALKICDPDFIDKEFRHIEDVFRKLCYPEYFINNAFKKARRIFYTGSSKEQDKKKFMNCLALPFNPHLNGIRKNVNKNYNDKINIVYNYNNTINRLLIHNNNSQTQHNKQIGVYEIPCTECDAKYFGESGRGLLTRIGEHKRAYKLHAENNALVSHSLKLDHRINWAESKA